MLPLGRCSEAALCKVYLDCSTPRNKPSPTPNEFDLARHVGSIVRLSTRRIKYDPDSDVSFPSDDLPPHAVSCESEFRFPAAAKAS